MAVIIIAIISKSINEYKISLCHYNLKKEEIRERVAFSLDNRNMFFDSGENWLLLHKHMKLSGWFSLLTSYYHSVSLVFHKVQSLSLSLSFFYFFFLDLFSPIEMALHKVSSSSSNHSNQFLSQTGTG